MTVIAQSGSVDLERYRGELTGYCYRMLGSGFEAEDAVQETLIKASRGVEGFEGRSSLRTWLYRIATNVCIDMSRQVQRRSQPMDMGPASVPDESLLGAPLDEASWVTPIATSAMAGAAGGGANDPAARAELRESVRLAFVTALQHLPPRQRAALILCEVLRWPVAEAAALLDTTVAALNSALQRSRATLAKLPQGADPQPLDPDDRLLLERYVDAFERYDMDALVALLHRDAVQSMPPFAMWLQGSQDIVRWMVLPGPSACRGSVLIAADANGLPAFGQYKPDGKGGWIPWAVQVIEARAGKISQLHFFLNLDGDGRLFSAMGLPLEPPAQD